jgi:hypothetical protein
VKDYYLKRIMELTEQDSLEFVVTADTASASVERFTIYLIKPSPVESAQGDSTTTASTDSLLYPQKESPGRPGHLKKITHFGALTEIAVTGEEEEYSDPDGRVRFYPNPVAGEMTVEISCDGEGDGPITGGLQIMLYNAIGMRVDTKPLIVRYGTCERSERQVPKRYVSLVMTVENLSPGAYLMRIDSRRQTSWIRFLKT